jgi:hypothetical protein
VPPEGATLLVNGPTRARSDSSPNIKRTYGRGAGAGQSRIAGMLAIVVVAAALAAAVATMSTGAPAPPVYQLISTPTPPTPPTPLIPNDHGYARVTAPSQTISCSISAELVACETSSKNWPSRSNGQPFHTVSVSADGKFQFVDADLGALAGKQELQPGAYEAQGWSVAATRNTIVFINDRTGHGMQLSTQGAQPF